MEIINLKSKEEYEKVWIRDRNFLTGGQIKIIAIIAMFLSHLAQSDFLYFLGEKYWMIADIFVFIGRISMPIFCFFTVQAVIYSTDIKKYFLRMLIFALISEIPFDLALNDSLFDFGTQNVIFTLLIGALTIFAIEKVFQSEKNDIIKIIFIILISLVGMPLGNILKTDYSYKGVLAIVLIYLTRNSKISTAMALFVGFFFESEMWGYVIEMTYGFVYLSIPLLMLYNGKKGKESKWLYYIFYPAHLLLIYFLKLFIL